MLRLLLTSLLLTGVACSQALVTVDPIAGSDVSTSGSAQSPYRTLTYAAAQTAGQAAVHFRLRRGTYAPSGGERFPIELPSVARVEADPLTTVPGDGAVIVDLESSASGAFGFADGRTSFATVEGLIVRGAVGGLVRERLRGGPTYVSLAVLRTRFESRVGIEVTGEQSASFAIRLDRCSFRGDRPLALTVERGVTAQLDMDLVEVRSTGSAGVRVDATAGGLISATLRGCRIADATQAGWYATTGNEGSVLGRFEHCLFFGNGLRGPQPAGGLVDEVVNSGRPPAHAIDNNVFVANSIDVHTAHPGYSFGANLVEQPLLTTRGSNVLGTAELVDGPAGELHLTPRSLGIDLANVADTTLFVDIDGEPRGRGGEGPPDLGPDEVWFGSVSTRTQPHVGDLFEMDIKGPQNVACGLLFSTARSSGGSFGPGLLHLSGSVIALPITWMTDARGIATLAFPVPKIPSLAGLETWWQTVMAQPPFLGCDAARVVVQY